ncbi:MAG: MFS transporter [Candidatus Bathyarchaeia archaeon]|jgi:MFS family permease
MLNDLRSHFYVTVFVASLGMGMNMYFIPVFAQSFGATFVDLGLIGTVWALATTITPFLIGYLAGRTKRVWVYVLSLTLNAFATLFLVLSRSVVDIMVLRFFGGIGIEAFWVTAEIMVTDLAPLEARVREMGRYGVALVLGVLIGPLIGGLVTESFGYVNLFIISAVVIGVSTVQALVWLVSGYRRTETLSFQSFSGSMRILKRLLPLYMMVVCYGIIWGLITAIFPGYANSIGISAVLIGFLFSAFGVARIFSYATAHRYSRFGEMRTLLFVSLVIFVGLITIAIFPTFLTLLVGIMLIGVGVGVVFPVTINIVSRNFPDEQASTAVASYETVINIGGTVGPYIFGMLTVITTIGRSFLLMSIFGILMALFAVNGTTKARR